MTGPSRRTFLTAGASTVGIALAGCLNSGVDDNTSEWEIDETLSVASATQYQSPSCGCCGVYAEYLDDHLGTELTTVEADDPTEIKERHGIAPDLRSCHTIELDEYVVEGHVPVEVIATLFDERPDIDGIALSGMPDGSPGMGGTKDEPWTIYEIDGSDDPEVYREL